MLQTAVTMAMHSQGFSLGGNVGVVTPYPHTYAWRILRLAMVVTAVTCLALEISTRHVVVFLHWMSILQVGTNHILCLLTSDAQLVKWNKCILEKLLQQSTEKAGMLAVIFAPIHWLCLGASSSPINVSSILFRIGSSDKLEYSFFRYGRKLHSVLLSIQHSYCFWRDIWT